MKFKKTYIKLYTDWLSFQKPYLKSLGNDNIDFRVFIETEYCQDSISDFDLLHLSDLDILENIFSNTLKKLLKKRKVNNNSDKILIEIFIDDIYLHFSVITLNTNYIKL